MRGTPGGGNPSARGDRRTSCDSPVFLVTRHTADVVSRNGITRTVRVTTHWHVRVTLLEAIDLIVAQGGRHVLDLPQ